MVLLQNWALLKFETWFPCQRYIDPFGGGTRRICGGNRWCYWTWRGDPVLEFLKSRHTWETQKTLKNRAIEVLVDILFFLLGGGEEGVRQGRGGRFCYWNPGGGVLPEGVGGEGAGRLCAGNFLGGGWLNIFCRGRNPHQEVDFFRSSPFTMHPVLRTGERNRPKTPKL